MLQKVDDEHIKVMVKMYELMKSPDAVDEWFDNKRKECDKLPEYE